MGLSQTLVNCVIWSSLLTIGIRVIAVKVDFVPLGWAGDVFNNRQA